MSKKIPKRRFKGFEDDWEQRKLEEIAPLRGGYAFQSENYLDKGIPIVRISNILTTGESGGDFNYYKELKNDQNFSLYNNDIVLAMSGATTGKTAIIYSEDNIKHYQNQRVGYFTKVKDVNYQMIATLVQSKLFERQLTSVLIAGAQPNVSSREIDSFEFYIPTEYKEQEQIGSFFKELDNLITLHQRKLEKTKALKDAYLEKMFPQDKEVKPEYRFKGFTDDWEQREFSKISDRVGARMKNGQLPNVEYEDIKAGQGRLINGELVVNKNKEGIHFEEGDLLYGFLRPYLDNRWIAQFEGLATGDWWILRNRKIDENFVHSLIQTEKFKSVANISTGTKMPRASWSLISNTMFYVPVNEIEISNIGSFFKELDNLITLHQRKLEKLKNLKQAYLNEMFVD